VVFFVVGALLWVARGQLVEPVDLRLGDCLYVRVPASQDPDRPIGQPEDVATALMQGGAERASCDASHGHEVSAVIPLNSFNDPRAEAPARCTAAFEPYVGRPPTGSIYTTFAAAPSAGDVNATPLVICLVARADGVWMDHPARASGE
jgi:hypothetical protein